MDRTKYLAKIEFNDTLADYHISFLQYYHDAFRKNSSDLVMKRLLKLNNDFERYIEQARCSQSKGNANGMVSAFLGLEKCIEDAHGLTDCFIIDGKIITKQC